MVVRSDNCKTLLEIPQSELVEVINLEYWGEHFQAHRRGTERVIDKGHFLLSYIEKEHGAETTITAQVGDTVWIISPDAPTVKLGDYTYVFAHNKAYYVVIFASSTEVEALGVLEAILEDISLYRECYEAISNDKVRANEASAAAAVSEECPIPDSPIHYTSSKAQTLKKVMSRTATGIMVTSMWLSNSMARGSQKLREGQPTNAPIELSEGFKKRMAHTARAAKALSKATHHVAGGFAWAGTKLFGGLFRFFGVNKAINSSEPVQEMTHATAAGIMEIYDAAEQAGYLCITSARNEAAAVASHRYGEDVGDVAKHGMNAAAYGVDSAMNMTGKRLAREGAKRAGKNILKQMAATHH